MRPNNSFVTKIFVTIFTVMLVILAAGCTPSGNDSQKSPPTEVQDTPDERVEAQTDTSVLDPAIPEPVAVQVTPSQDGASIIADRCAKCHMANWIEQYKKTRAEWEVTLAKMETLGVSLDDSEKAVLLDYLVADGEP